MTGAQFRLHRGMLRLFRAYHEGGPTFTGERVTTEGSPSVVKVTEVLSARTLWAMPYTQERFSTTFPEIPVWNTLYVIFADEGTDMRSRDVYTDGTRAYQITGLPVTHAGWILGPAQLTDVLSVTPTTQAGYRSPLWIFGIGA